MVKTSRRLREIIIRIRRTLFPPLALSALVLFVLLIASTPASAGELQITFHGIPPGEGSYVPPLPSGLGLSEGGARPWAGFSFWVDQRGHYQIFQHDVTHIPLFDRLVLYRGPVDTKAPLERLIKVTDDNKTTRGTMDVMLEAGVIYYLLYTTSSPNDTVRYFYGHISGPGEIRRSYCQPPGSDNFDVFSDMGDALMFEFRRPGEVPRQLCAWVDWRDHQGNTGVGTTTAYRSDDSGMFWFFDRDNWELLVKVLDGCAVNGHYWVFVAGTTDVEFDLRVDWWFGPDVNDARVYHNDLGHPADAITDTAAFPCGDL